MQAGLGAVDFVRLSVAMRRGLLIYDLCPVERDLAGLLILETFDQGRCRAPVRLEAWAMRLGRMSARADKLERLAFKPLVELGLVDLNAGQGTYELRPNIETWSKLRAWRSHSQPANGTPDLSPALAVARPLDEALSSWSREQTLAGEEQKAESRKLTMGLADKSAGEWRINPPAVADKSTTQETPITTGLSSGLGATADKSAGLQLLAAAALKLSNKAAAASCTADLSATIAPGQDPTATALAWLESIDERGMLRVPAFAVQWLKLCQERPDWILSRARRRLAEVQPANPLGFLAKMARDEGLLAKDR